MRWTRTGSGTLRAAPARAARQSTCPPQLDRDAEPPSPSPPLASGQPPPRTIGPAGQQRQRQRQRQRPKPGPHPPPHTPPGPPAPPASPELGPPPQVVWW